MAEPETSRYYPSLANYLDKYVLVIAGGQGRNSFLRSVDMYNVESDEWKPAPEIAEAMSDHSSCSLYKWVYIFGGFKGS